MHRVGALYALLLASEMVAIAVLATQRELILADPSTTRIAWMETWGGKYRDYSYDAAFAAGVLYVTGASASFGEGVINLVLLKYSEAGDLLLNETLSLGGYTMGRGVASDGSTVYVCGIHTAENVSSSLLLRYGLDGRLIWKREWRPDADAKSTGVALDRAGNIYVTGYVTESTDVKRIFLLKYDAGGTLLFSSVEEAEGSETAWGIAVSDAVYLCGEASNDTTSPGVRSSNMLLRKVGLDSRVIWSRETSVGYSNAANSVDASDDISVAGYALFANGTAKMLLRRYGGDGGLRGTLVLSEFYIEEMAWGVARAGKYTYLVGHAQPNISVIGIGSVYKLGPDMHTILWRDHYGGGPVDRARAAVVSGDDVYVVGESYWYGLDMQVSVKKYVSPNAALDPVVSEALTLSPLLIGLLLLAVALYSASTIKRGRQPTGQARL